MCSGSKNSKLNFIPTIDGLRALAVISVVIYHAKFQFNGSYILQGGFLGVDIFFVISGFLISKIIHSEIDKTNDFSFYNFYIKRFKRLFPAIFLIIILTTVTGFVILSPKSFLDLAYQSLFTITGLSNFYFWITNNAYAAESSLLKPLLHTWSLALEMQYYILFPIFFYFIIKYLKRYLIPIILFFLLISLGVAETLVLTKKLSFNFYFLFSRGFEFLFGTILFLITLNKLINDNKSKLISIFPLVGMVMVIYSLIIFNDKDNLPSILTFSTLIGIGLLILYQEKNILINKILTNKVVLFFGKISYSVYLFHFPIFAFARYIEFINYETNAKKIFLIIFTILLSSLSYYFIEKPFRYKYKLKEILITTFSLLIVIILNLKIIKTEGYDNRNTIETFVSIKNSDEIIFNKSGKKGEVLFIGDSHGEALLFDLNEKLKNEGYNLTYLFTHIYTPKLSLYDNDNIKFKEFNNNNENIKNYLNSKKNLIVLLHFRWSQRLLGTDFDDNEIIGNYLEDNSISLKPSNQYINEEERITVIKKEIIETLNSILKIGHKVILVYPVPEHEFNPYNKQHINNIFNFKNILSKDKYRILSTSYSNFKKRNDLAYDILGSIKHKNLYRIYPEKYFCNNELKNRCITNSNNKLYYYDGDHLSIFGSKYVNKAILKVIRNIN